MLLHTDAERLQVKVIWFEELACCQQASALGVSIVDLRAAGVMTNVFSNASAHVPRHVNDRLVATASDFSAGHAKPSALTNINVNEH